MRNRAAALAACLLVIASPARPDAPLTLDDAMTRVVAAHPQLRAFEPLSAVREAERAEAALPPALAAGASLENAFGTGDARLLTGMELTLSLASVLERETKPAARVELARRRVDALATHRAAARLDLLAETARRYLDVIHARAQHAIAATDVAQRQRSINGARQRVQAGATPTSELLAAEAAHARAQIALARSAGRQEAARLQLAALWGEHAPNFEIAAANPLELPAIAGVATLTALLDNNPELVTFADEQRIREARLQLARTAAIPDLAWEVGVRRLENSGDFALVGSLSMPLDTRRYAAPAIDAARAELVALGIDREVRALSLRSTLLAAHGRYSGARDEALTLHRDVLPMLGRAERAAEEAYRAGAASYLAWAQLQAERIETARQALDVALDAQRALIEIQRLTGEPFVAAAAPATTTPDLQGATQ